MHFEYKLFKYQIKYFCIGVDRRLIGTWIKNKEKLFSQFHKRSRYRVKRENNTCHHPQLEVQLMSWFVEQRERHVCVSVISLKAQADIIYDQIHAQDPAFYFSANDVVISIRLTRCVYAFLYIANLTLASRSFVPTPSSSQSMSITNTSGDGSGGGNNCNIDLLLLHSPTSKQF